MEIYKNETYTFAERAADLVSHMTLDEKILQLGNQAPAIPRLGIPAYNYWSEASHGYFGPFQFQPMDVTSYPVCLAMSQSWDIRLMEKVTSAIGDECRAHYNSSGTPLHMWCPTINMARDPRNGRSDENFGEDPFLTGKMAAAYVRGMQGQDEKYIKTVSTPKHYALNSSENNRHQGTSNVDEATLREYYTPAFKRAVTEGGAKSIMTSYNRINGVPASANRMLLDTLLREEWGFDGFVVSDCGAVLDLYENPMFNGGEEKLSGHYYAKNGKEASVMTLKAGTDMSCGTEHKKNLKEALEEGMIDENVVNRALIRIFTTRFELGLFEEEKPFADLDASVICDEAKKKLAVEMADESIVLLKNEKQLLPLKKSRLKKILVVGPNAIYRELGGYSAGSMSKIIDTVVNVLPLDGIKNAVRDTEIEVAYEKGWCTDKESGAGGIMNVLPGAGPQDASDMNSAGDMMSMVTDMFGEGVDLMQLGMAFLSPEKFTPEDPDKCGDAEILWNRAKDAARDADAVIMIAGTDSSTASEEHDRYSLELPYGQNEKILEMLGINENTIVVLNTLGAVTGSFFEKAHTVLNVHFAGQEQGTAVADVLFGKVNPSAKLTATWYRAQEDLGALNDYGIRKQDTVERKPRTYMYLEKEPLFPFGYGKSYTSFDYESLLVNRQEDVLYISLDVTNTGSVDGTEIVQIYAAKVIPEKMADNKPFRQLKGFARVELKAGEKQTVRVEIPVKELAFWNYYENRMLVEPGLYRIEAGRSSADIVLSREITIDERPKSVLSNVSIYGQQYVMKTGSRSMIKVIAVLDDTTRLSAEQYQTSCRSSDETVASVDDDGVIWAKAPGVATITARVAYEGRIAEDKTVCVVC